MLRAVALSFLLCLACAGQSDQPVIDNERVTVYDVIGTLRAAKTDFVEIPMSGKQAVRYGYAGDMPGRPGVRSVVIELKNRTVEPLPNGSGFPNAFPRPHVEKLLENDKIIVWRYAWNPGEPTPMHFHDKDVVVIYKEDTALKSTTPDGASTVNEYKAGQIRFNRRDRVHTELLVKGAGSAIMTELK